jgi:hypothetical protein
LILSVGARESAAAPLDGQKNPRSKTGVFLIRIEDCFEKRPSKNNYGRQAAGSHLFCKPAPLAQVQPMLPVLSIAVIVNVAAAMLAFALLP